MDSLFRKESMDQLTMHDKVGVYVSATQRRGWLILIALLILITSFLVWGFTGSSHHFSGHKTDRGQSYGYFMASDVK